MIIIIIRRTKHQQTSFLTDNLSRSSFQAFSVEASLPIHIDIMEKTHFGHIFDTKLSHIHDKFGGSVQFDIRIKLYLVTIQNSIV